LCPYLILGTSVIVGFIECMWWSSFISIIWNSFRSIDLKTFFKMYSKILQWICIEMAYVFCCRLFFSAVILLPIVNMFKWLLTFWVNLGKSYDCRNLSVFLNFSVPRIYVFRVLHNDPLNLLCICCDIPFFTSTFINLTFSILLLFRAGQSFQITKFLLIWLFVFLSIHFLNYCSKKCPP
jgi:hypothetical protein